MEGLSPLSETTTRASSWWTQRGSTDLVTGNSSTSPSGFTIRVVHRLWEKNDVRGVMNAMEKMFDHAVYADLIGVLIEKSDIVTLDICTCLLPLLTNLLESKMDRYIVISLEMLLKLVRNFGPVIHSTLSASTSVGVDLQSEQRLERCNLCYIELEKVKHYLPSLTRRGSVSKFALELSLALQEVYYE